jgi:hypothetical protein
LLFALLLEVITVMRMTGYPPSLEETMLGAQTLWLFSILSLVLLFYQAFSLVSTAAWYIDAAGVGDLIGLEDIVMNTVANSFTNGNFGKALVQVAVSKYHSFVKLKSFQWLYIAENRVACKSENSTFNFHIWDDGQ